MINLLNRFSGFHELYREHARQNVARPPYIPSPRLKIGPAEELKPVTRIVWYGPKPRNPKIETALNQEQIKYMGKGPFVQQDEFPDEGYLGEGLYPV